MYLRCSPICIPSRNAKTKCPANVKPKVFSELSSDRRNHVFVQRRCACYEWTDFWPNNSEVLCQTWVFAYVSKPRPQACSHSCLSHLFVLLSIVILQDFYHVHELYTCKFLVDSNTISCANLYIITFVFLGFYQSIMEDPSSSGGWRFAQCFGDKGDVEDITEGTLDLICAARRGSACRHGHL